MVQIVLEVFAVLRGVSVVLMVLAIQVLIALLGVSGHLIRPLKVWFIPYLLQHPVYWLSEYGIDSLSVGRPAKSLFGRLLLYRSDLKSLIS